MIQEILTTFLIRTIRLRPTGLKVRLRIVPVNKGCVTFDESLIPAATFMSHALFLGYPTAPGTKNPQLVGVLNLEQIADPEPPVEIGVFWGCGEDLTDKTHMQHESAKCLAPDASEPQFASSVAGTFSHRISLARYGIVKHLPPSVALDKVLGAWLNRNPHNGGLDRRGSWKIPGLVYSPISINGPVWTGGSVGTRSQTSPTPAREVCMAIMYALLQIEKPALQTATSLSKLQVDAPLDIRYQDYLQAINHILQSRLDTMEYLKSVLPPTLPADVRVYETVYSVVQDELHQLIAAVLDWLLRPLSGILVKTPKSEGGLLLGLCRNIRASQRFLEHISENDSAGKSAIVSQARLPPVRETKRPDCLDYVSILQCLEVPDIRRLYLSALQTQLGADSPPDGPVQRVLERLLASRKFGFDYPHRYLNRNFGWRATVGKKPFGAMVHHGFCCCRKANSNKIMRFGVPVEELDYCELRSVVCHGDTQICIITMRNQAQDTEGAAPGGQKGPLRNILLVKVFRGETEVACFDLGWNLIMELRDEVGRVHFTGRYYALFNPFTWGQLLILDLLPCLQEYPAAPKMAIQSLVGFEMHKNVLLHVGFTDRFFSCLEIKVHRSPESEIESVLTTRLCIVDLDLAPGPKHAVIVPLDMNLGSIPNDVWASHYSVKVQIQRNICWTKDTRRLYYTVYKLDRRKAVRGSLAVMAFGISHTLDSISTLAWNMFEPDPLMRAQESPYNKILTKTLQTSIREYLIVDLIIPSEIEYANQEHPWIVLARCLFTVHKRLIHWVRVNGQLSHAPPDRVGYPMRYAGYSTIHLQLFHHRRVFSDVKVVSTIHRLEYISL